MLQFYRVILSSTLLREVEETPRHAQIIAWFRSLPIWLDFGDLRVVHACWHQPSIDKLQASAGNHQRLSDDLILYGSRKGHPLYQAIETVFKGPELTLPPGISYRSDEGKERHEVRIAWWQENLSTYRQAAHVSQKFKASVPLTPRPATAPNGSPWPTAAGYIRNSKVRNAKGLSSITVDNTQSDSDVFVKLVSLQGADWLAEADSGALHRSEVRRIASQRKD
jgi:hypothetical protein